MDRQRTDLGELEQRAADGGARRARLDTNGSLVEAIGMYRSAGSREVRTYNNDEPYADHWFEKWLPARQPTGSPTRGRRT